MSEELIRLKGISKSYGKHQVLNGVDMTVNKGDIYGLIGKNGSGKTTLFKIILGLSPYQAGECSCRALQSRSEAETRHCKRTSRQADLLRISSSLLHCITPLPFN